MGLPSLLFGAKASPGRRARSNLRSEAEITRSSLCSHVGPGLGWFEGRGQLGLSHGDPISFLLDSRASSGLASSL